MIIENLSLIFDFVKYCQDGRLKVNALQAWSFRFEEMNHIDPNNHTYVLSSHEPKAHR